MERKGQMVNILVSREEKVVLKKHQKLNNYSNLTKKVKKIWNLTQVLIAPVVTEAPGVTLKRLTDWLKMLYVKSNNEIL